jgi:HlyD family secretion protein
MIKNRQLLAVLAIAACDRGDVPAGYQGVVELDERVLAFEVPGRVTQVTALRGEVVDPARVIATLDDAQPRASIVVREAEARAAQERAKLAAAGGRIEDIRALEAQLRAARANEQLAVKRHADDQLLVSKGALAQSIADDSDARRKTAVAERQAIEQQLRELRAGARGEEIAGARAQASAADAVVKLEADRASRYQLRALQPGEVLDVHVEAGEVVAAGTPVVTVGDTTHPYVDVFVPQQELAAIRVGSHATIRVDATPQAFKGVVEHVSRRTEFTPRFIFNRAERANLVIRVRVRVDDAQRALHAGTPAFVTIGA